MAVTNEEILAALERMQGRDGNGDAVTLAVLKSQYERMEQVLDKRAEAQDQDHDRLTQVEGAVKTLQHRVSGFAAIQLAITGLASAIAARLGMTN